MTIQEYVERGREAVEAIKDYDQAQTDKLVYEAAKIIYQHAAELAREAVDETGLGYYEDKICKNTDTPAAFWAYLRDKKSVGIISENKETGIIEVAHPVGVIACVTPATNPNVTPLGNFMDAVKGKNAIIVSPAPRAARSTTHTVELIREAMVKCGAPADLIQVLSEVTLANSQALMEACDLVIATGGSVVYGKEAMEHLSRIGTVVYLKLPYASLVRRLGNLKDRGVVLKEGQTLKSLYEERTPLYEKYAHLTVDEEKAGIRETVELVVQALKEL